MPLAEEPLEGDPLVAERFKSMDDLKHRLIELGPSPDTYDRLFDLVGPDDEDEAKDSLARFFSGSPTALCFLYKLLVKEGKANAVDEDLVAEIQGMHPDLNPEANGKEEETATAAPEGELGVVPQTPVASSNKTEKTAEPMFSEEYIKEAAKEGLFIKTASGFTGGPGNANYVMHGPEQTRICPKIRDLVSTHICRYHCLDGLTIDDAETVCGEAIWRQAVMDKFSRDFKDEDGKWRSGYIRGRFHTEQNTEGNDYQLKPGQRGRPIKENAWSTEKRLQEMLKAERAERGYTETNSPDHADVYKFDQHELHDGPDNVQLDAKERDAIAKNASAGREVKTAESMFGETGEIDPLTARPGIEETPGFAEFEEEHYAEPTEPEEGDITTSDHENWFQYGKHYHEGDEASLLAKMDEENFRPDIWFVSDHGNAHLISKSMYEAGGLETEASRTFNLRSAKKKKKWNPNPWAVCTDSVGRSDKAKYERCVQDVKKKQSFNLKRTKEAMGDPLNPPMKAGYVSSMCQTPGCKTGSIGYKSGQDTCPGCRGPLKHMTRAEVGRMSGVTTKTSLDPTVTKANGVYKANLGKFAAFGDSPEDAMRKLEKQIPDTVEQEAEQLQELISPKEEPVPSTPSAIPAPAERQEPAAEEQEFVDADNLDGYIEQDLAQKDENEIRDTEATADALGCGPDEPIMEA